MTTLVLLAIVGCKHGDDTAVSDSGTATGTVTDTGTGTAFQGNSYTGYVQFGRDETTDGLQALVAMVQVQSLTGPVLAGATLASATIGGGTGVFTVNLPDTPPATQIGDLGGAYAGTKAAIYMGMIDDDENGDKAYSAGETVVGVNLDLWLMYVDPSGTIPDGWPTGWTLVNPNYGTGAAPVFSKIGTEAAINLRGAEARSYVSGAWASVPAGNYGVIMMDTHWWTDGTMPTSHPTDAPINDKGAFSTILSARPPGEQFYKDDPSKVWYMTANPMVYTDANLNAKFDDSDPIDGSTICYVVGNAPLFERYVIPPTTLDDAIALELKGWSAGWHAVVSTTGEELDHNQTTSPGAVTIDPATCTIPLPSSAH